MKDFGVKKVIIKNNFIRIFVIRVIGEIYLKKGLE